ncbi:hypothetical protein RJ53_10440 [Methanocalculus chunghsingensis]|uniref:Uncharacterized protein n=1 Tax=Methanocalculus chunghsingensis TaxID=156457 RepID=A0A8J7WBH1_9EURY|nr:hypothetical protein [Methanocalculus chunghsingensis]MBR1369872.1 hypothetical protein [Methanocalculus chunghsingensis]
MESFATEEMAYQQSTSISEITPQTIARHSQTEMIQARFDTLCRSHPSTSARVRHPLPPQKRRYRATFSLTPALAEPLELYRRNGGNASALASRLLSLYFEGEIRVDDDSARFSFREAKIEEEQAELNRLSALVTSAHQRQEEQKKKEGAIQEERRRLIRTEFADAAGNPRSWRTDLRIDGFDPNAVIRSRAESLSDRLVVPVSGVIEMIAEEIPGLLAVKGDGVDMAFRKN